jgi:hypothetical protein
MKTKVKDAAKKSVPHVASLLMLGICLMSLMLSRYIDDLLTYLLICSSVVCLLLLIYVFKLYYLIIISLFLFFLLPGFNFPYFLKYYEGSEIESYYHVSQNGHEAYAVIYRNNSVILFEKSGESISCLGRYGRLSGGYCRQMFKPFSEKENSKLKPPKGG